MINGVLNFFYPKTQELPPRENVNITEGIRSADSTTEEFITLSREWLAKSPQENEEYSPSLLLAYLQDRFMGVFNLEHFNHDNYGDDPDSDCDCEEDMLAKTTLPSLPREVPTKANLAISDKELIELADLLNDLGLALLGDSTIIENLIDEIENSTYSDNDECNPFDIGSFAVCAGILRETFKERGLAPRW